MGDKQEVKALVLIKRRRNPKFCRELRAERPELRKKTQPQLVPAIALALITLKPHEKPPEPALGPASLDLHPMQGLVHLRGRATPQTEE